MKDQPRARGAFEPQRERRLALVLWNGDVGGAEVLNFKLADCLRRLGAQVTILFVGTPWPLAERFERVQIPYVGLELGRGRKVLLHPRRYAAATKRAGPDGALLMERGFMAGVLRAGGYRAPIVAVEHGALLAERRRRAISHRLVRELGRVAGACADDVEVAVSDFMLAQMRRRVHARTTMRIYNGIDPDVYREGACSEGVADAAPARTLDAVPARTLDAAPGGRTPNRMDEGRLVVGFAGRLVAGKGTEHLIAAVARVARAGVHPPLELLIAGDGPERASLEGQVSQLGLASQVRFVGVVDDMVAFWQRCDVAAIPSQAAESFSMVTLEAMSCGKAIVASRVGAIPELVLDGQTGTLVAPGDADALARALLRYAERPDLRSQHGLAARARAIERFHIEDCARSYVALFDELARRRAGRRRRTEPAPDRRSRRTDDATAPASAPPAEALPSDPLRQSSR
jgi:glycosyltransferase involved in cell wall biosynthesis